MSSLLDESMVQDEEAEQEMLVVEEQEQSLPQMDPEPEMGTAAAYDTSPPLLHQNPPILAESAQPNTIDIGRLLATLAGMEDNMNERMQQMNNKMDGNTREMEGMTQTMREEMQCMGAGLQEGQEQLKGGNGKEHDGGRAIQNRAGGTATGDSGRN